MSAINYDTMPIDVNHALADRDHEIMELQARVDEMRDVLQQVADAFGPRRITDLTKPELDAVLLVYATVSRNKRKRDAA